MEREKGLVGHAVRRELSLRQAKIVGKVGKPEELVSQLEAELSIVLAEAPRIYREKLFVLDFNAYVAELEPELHAEIDLLSKNLAELIREVGLEGALEWITPEKVEHTFRSADLDLSGRVDKIMLEDGKHVPVEIKTGRASDGVWAGDRIQVAGYILLMEEEYGEHIPYGFVEYTRVCDRRPVLASEKLRRSVFETRDEIKKILGGDVPEVCPHGSGKKCESCGLKKECYKV